MKLSELSEKRRFVQVSKYRRKRIKQLQQLLVKLGEYQSFVKGTDYHKYRTSIVEDFLNHELVKKRKDLKELLNLMMTKTFPIEDKANSYFSELKVAMLYNYLHRNEISNL